MNKKKLVIIGLFVILVSIGTKAIYDYYNHIYIGVLLSDAQSKDCQVLLLNKDLNIKKQIKLDAYYAPSASYSNGSIFIPTSYDNKLFHIDKNLNVSQKSVELAATFIETKEEEQLMLFNTPTKTLATATNKVYFNTNGKSKLLDIPNSLLLCGDFDKKYIYVIGTSFDHDYFGEENLFIINKASLKILSKKPIPENMRVLSAKLVDNKLVIGSDEAVNCIYYYNIDTEKFDKVPYNNLLTNSIDVSKIIYNDNHIFMVSLTGNIISLNRKTLSIENSILLKDNTVLSADIRDNKLYTLSENNSDRQTAIINVFNCDSLRKLSTSKIDHIRYTMPRDIFTYK